VAVPSFALAISYSGVFIAEVFRAGIQEVGKGTNTRSGKSIWGLSNWHRFALTRLPQAIAENFTATGQRPRRHDFKDSALVSVLGVQDITQLGKIYSSSTFQFFELTMSLLYVPCSLP